MKGEILIVGAGPTGLVLALTLDKYNVPFKIIDKKSQPDNLSKAMLVVPGTLEHYSQLGIVDQVLEEGLEPERIMLHTGKERIDIDFDAFRTPVSRYARIFTYPQDAHERLLIELLKARGHSIHWETAFESLTQKVDQVKVQLQTKEASFSETFTYVVGADGGSSQVRADLNLSFPGKTHQKKFFVADVQLKNMSFQEKSVRFFRTRQHFLLVFPLSTQTTQRLIGIVPDELAGQNNLKMTHLAPIVEEDLGLEVVESQWFSEYKIHHRLAESFKAGNVFLAGDAAHLHSPVGGQGMNAGIGDAVNLGWKLAQVIKGKSPKQLLYTYHEERHGYAKKLVATTDRAFTMMTSDHLLLRKFRQAFLANFADFLINKTDRVRNLLFQTLSQMAIQYKSSALNAEDVENPLLGARLPFYENNLEFTDEMKWHVQIYGQADASFQAFLKKAGLPYFIIEWEEQMKKEKFSKDTAYLIRPDGYIAWASDKQDASSLARYLDKWRLGN